MVFASPAVLYSAENKDDYKVRFGVIEQDNAGKDFLSKETMTIPRKFKETGFRFGYEILPSSQDSYTCQYIIHVPSPPGTITGGLEAVNPKKPTTIITSHKKKIPGGAYVDAMWFDHGDPSGDCSIDIFVNDKLLKNIKFTVKAD